MGHMIGVVEPGLGCYCLTCLGFAGVESKISVRCLCSKGGFSSVRCRIGVPCPSMLYIARQNRSSNWRRYQMVIKIAVLEVPLLSCFSALLSFNPKMRRYLLLSSAVMKALALIVLFFVHLTPAIG